MSGVLPGAGQFRHRGQTSLPRCARLYGLQPVALVVSEPAMTPRHFNLGQSVVYRIGRVNQGRFVIVGVLSQPPRDKLRYRIRSQDDDTIEHVVEESELSAT
jgi:hypothetical protein